MALPLAQIPTATDAEDEDALKRGAPLPVQSPLPAVPPAAPPNQSPQPLSDVGGTAKGLSDISSATPVAPLSAPAVPPAVASPTPAHQPLPGELRGDDRAAEVQREYDMAYKLGTQHLNHWSSPEEWEKARDAARKQAFDYASAKSAAQLGGLDVQQTKAQGYLQNMQAINKYKTDAAAETHRKNTMTGDYQSARVTVQTALAEARADANRIRAAGQEIGQQNADTAARSVEIDAENKLFNNGITGIRTRAELEKWSAERTATEIASYLKMMEGLKAGTINAGPEASIVGHAPAIVQDVLGTQGKALGATRGAFGDVGGRLSGVGNAPPEQPSAVPPLPVGGYGAGPRPQAGPLMSGLRNNPVGAGASASLKAAAHRMATPSPSADIANLPAPAPGAENITAPPGQGPRIPPGAAPVLPEVTPAGPPMAGSPPPAAVPIGGVDEAVLMRAGMSSQDAQETATLAADPDPQKKAAALKLYARAKALVGKGQKFKAAGGG